MLPETLCGIGKETRSETADNLDYSSEGTPEDEWDRGEGLTVFRDSVPMLCR